MGRIIEGSWDCPYCGNKVAGGTYVLIPKTVTLQVTDLEWERHIAIDEWKLVNENDWSLPEGAKLVDKRREIHHFDTVLDHYKTVTEQRSETYISGYDTRTGYRDLGNGYFEEYEYEVPVYDKRYYTVTHEEPVYKEVPVYAKEESIYSPPKTN